MAIVEPFQDWGGGQSTSRDTSSNQQPPAQPPSRATNSWSWASADAGSLDNVARAPSRNTIAEANARVESTYDPANWSDARNFSAVREQQEAISNHFGTERPQYYDPTIAARAEQNNSRYNDEVDLYNVTLAEAAPIVTEPYKPKVWEYQGEIADPRLATLVEENDPHSDEARFAVLSAETDDLTAQIDNWNGTDNDPIFDELVRERNGRIEDLSERDDDRTIATTRLVNDGESAADALIGSAAVMYQDAPVSTLLKDTNARVDEEPEFDPIAYGMQVELNNRTGHLFEDRGQDIEPQRFGYTDTEAIEPLRHADAATEGGIDQRIEYLSLDDDEQASLTIATNFEETFGADRVSGGDEVLREIAEGEHEEVVLERLAESGLENEALEQAYGDIVQTAEYYTENTADRQRLDYANDDDPDVDHTYTVLDGQAHFMATSQGSDSELLLDQRRDFVMKYVGEEFDVMYLNPMESAYDGDVRILGELSTDEQGHLLETYTDTLSDLFLYEADEDIPARTMLAPAIDGDGNFQNELRTEFANEAIEIQMLHPTDPHGQAAAVVFAGESLFGLDDASRVEFIRGLDGEIPVGDGQVVSEAQVFASALVLPEHGERSDRYRGNHWRTGYEARTNTIGQTINALNEASPADRAMTGAESDFIGVSFFTTPQGVHNMRIQGRDASQDAMFSDILGEGVAKATYGGDSDAVEFHSDRLGGALASWDTWEIIGSGTDTDNVTRTQVMSTLVHGRYDRAGELEFWTVGDFENNDASAVAADITVDNAAQLREARGEGELTVSDENNLREIVATEEGTDLFGFGERNSHTLRTQFTAMVFDNDWTDQQFGDGNGWDNEVVNGQYLVDMALRANDGEPLTLEQIANIREIGESRVGRDNLGLESDMSDAGRVAYLNETLDHDWSVDTFEETDDISLNRTMSFGFADEHFDSFRQGGEQHVALQRFSEPDDGSFNGDVDGYVRTALNIPEGGDDVVGEIVAQIGEDVDAIDIIPITLNTGDEQFDLVLFEVEDGGETKYVDLNGKEFSDPDDWWESNRLPPGTVVFSGNTDVEGDTKVHDWNFEGVAGDGNATTVAVTTKEYPDTFWEQHGGKIVTGVVIVGGVLVVVGTAGAATPLVSGGAAAYAGTTGAALLTGVGAYELGSGAADLHDHVTHGGSASLDDPIARGAYFNIVGGGLTVVTAGSAGIAFKGGNLATRLAGSPIASNALRGFNLADGAAQLGINAYEANRILNSDLPEEEKTRQLAKLGIFSAVDLGLPIIANRAIGSNADLVDIARTTNPNLTDADINQAVDLGAQTPMHLADFPQIRDGVRGRMELVPQAQADIDSISTGIADQYGGRIYGGPKTEESAIQKVMLRGANVDGLNDLARNTIVVHADQIDAVTAELQMLNPVKLGGGNTETGFTNVNAKVTTSNGMVAEIQVNTPEMIYAGFDEATARNFLGDELYDYLDNNLDLPGGGGRSHEFYDTIRVMPQGEQRVQASEEARAYHSAVAEQAANLDQDVIRELLDP